MLEDGWIERHEDDLSNGDSRERKLYSLTDLGRRIFELETKRLQKLVRLTARLNERQ
jgi:DNA-binding PadR family transcriptional regulator